MYAWQNLQHCCLTGTAGGKRRRGKNWNRNREEKIMSLKKMFILIGSILLIGLIVTTIVLGASSIARSDETIERIDRKIAEYEKNR